MPVITEGLNLGDLLKYEAPNLYSRDQVTVGAGQNLPLGAVVGLVTATGKVKQIDPLGHRRQSVRRRRADAGRRRHADRP